MTLEEQIVEAENEVVYRAQSEQIWGGSHNAFILKKAIERLKTLEAKRADA